MLAATVVFVTAGLCILSTWQRGQIAFDEEVRTNLIRLASASAAVVDPVAHQRITQPEQLNGPEYNQAVAPLREILHHTPGIKYVYTVIQQDDTVYFILDSADPGDHDGDGKDDQSHVMEEYEDADEQMLQALKSGEAISSAEPYEDDWGRFMSAYAPIHDADGGMIALVGVDITAENYDKRIGAMKSAALWSLIPAAILSLVVGVATAFLRRASQLALRKRDHAERLLCEHIETLAGSNEALAEARREAEAGSAAKSAFLANMSHEIRTPMTAILGFADMLAERNLNAEQQRDCIETIRRNGEHLLGLINDILDLSKIEAQMLTTERIPTPVSGIIRDTVTSLRSRAEAKGLSVSAEIGPDVPRLILSDPLRVRQILINLLGNAIKFTEKGSVGVTANVVQRPQDTPVIEICVRDTGIGLTPEQLAKLFKPFSQADQSTTRRFGGTGLGLHISQRVANLLGGEIRIESQYGAGSAFFLVLPAISADESASRESTSPAFSPEAQKPEATATAGPLVPLAGRKILLAEDGPDNQRLISFHLRRAGAEVTIADNGRRAIELLTIDGTFEGALRDPPPFEIMLLDMQMPVLDGYGTATALRQRGFARPIVALTAHAMQGDRDRCIAAGCDEYATKPIVARDLVACVLRLLAEPYTHTPQDQSAARAAEPAS
ncbi:MAG: response regulator [Planctomycetes bacterium]|nr:response regulator [Planctomycetota bacterium]